MEKHDTLLIACADKEGRAYLRSVLEQHYNLLEAVNVPQTMLLLRQNIECICAVLVDSSLRSMADKMDLTEESAMQLMSRIPVIVISADNTSPEELSLFFRYGASDVIPLHYDPYALLRRIDTLVELNLHKQNLEQIVSEQADVLRHSSDSMIDAMSSIIEYRSVESGNHILRVRHFTRILMEEVMRHCPEYGITDRLVSIISRASALHDIGKIAIADAILMKPGKLTEEEWEQMKTHTITGCQILNNLKGTVEEDYLRYAHNICHYHHERWDGKGYPEGLSGEDIPICAQVVGLADAYDALTSKRAYKEAYSFVEAVNMILKGECGIFSPKLLECFKHVTDRFDALTQEYADGRSPKDAPFDMTLPPPVQSQENILARTRAMCYSLVHYLGAFMVEVDMKNRLFHVIYNPYPELVTMQKVSTLEELQDLAVNRIVVPEEREQMHRVIHQEIPRFIREDLRRLSFRFRYQSQGGEESGSFEMTLLRSGNGGDGRSSLAILCRRLESVQTTGSVGSLMGPLPGSSYICRNDREFTLVHADQDTFDLGGYSLTEIRQTFGGSLSRFIHPEDREMVRREFDNQLERGTQVRLEHRVLFKDGKSAWVSNKSRLFIGRDGQEYLYCILSDISHTKAAYEALQYRMERYENILTQTEHVLFEWDVLQDNMEFSDNWEDVFGGIPQRQKMHDLLYSGTFFHPDDVPLILDSISRMESGSNYEKVETRMATNRGRYLWCRFRAAAERDGQGALLRVTGIIINIDSEKQAERILQDRAERDSLTKLLNKETGRKQAETYLSRFPEGISCALLIIDLDDFKQVNDQYGHLFGDAILTKAARAIEKQFQAQDIVSRIGGDEFMVLVRGTADRNLLESRCCRLTDALRNAFYSLNRRMQLSCSIGVALGPEHGKNYYDLFAHADQALYRAKAMGKNTYCIYEKAKPGMDVKFLSGTAVNTPIDSDVEPGLAEDNIVRYSFQKLYAARDVEAAVNEVIGVLGRKMNVSRVYVFENTRDNLYCNNTFEWCNEGITAEIQNLQGISYQWDIPGYEDNFNEEGLFYLPDVAALPKEARDIVEAQGIQSMLQCAIRQDGVFRGYIGFDECSEQRLWTKEEINMLTYFADVLAVFLLKHREQERAQFQAEELNTILDNQNNWIYIVEPDSYKLRYLNKRVRRDASQAKTGMPCYSAILGKDSPCEDCPMRVMEEGKTGRLVVQDPRFGRLLTEATAIQWQGERSFYVTSREMPQG